MPQVRANDIDIEYESFGSKNSETILLIMGLGAQLTQWPMELCHALVARGYRVIRFDNRDAGLSTHMVRDRAFAFSDAFFALASGKSGFATYTLSDMAADAVGLLDALKIDKAHIVGASMGGMIAQHIVADYPERSLSLTSIMSSSGNPMLPPPKARVFGLFMPQSGVRDAEAIVAHGIKTYEMIGSPGFPTDAETLRDWVERDVARAYDPQGVTRQMAAVLSDGDRRAKLRQISVPCVVLHGRDDPLVPMAAAEDTAANISGAELRIIAGMGHDMPMALLGQIEDAIVSAAERASGVQKVEEPTIVEKIREVVVPELVAPEPIAGNASAERVGSLVRVRNWFAEQSERFRRGREKEDPHPTLSQRERVR